MSYEIETTIGFDNIKITGAIGKWIYVIHQDEQTDEYMYLKFTKKKYIKIVKEHLDWKTFYCETKDEFCGVGLVDVKGHQVGIGLYNFFIIETSKTIQLQIPIYLVEDYLIYMEHG